MGTVIIGGGPRPGAAIYSVTRISSDPTKDEPSTYEIRDGDEVLMRCQKRSHAEALLPLIRSGE